MNYDKEGGCSLTPRMVKAGVQRPHRSRARAHKHTPSGIPTCDSGQRESQEHEALISNSVIWLR